MYIAKSLSLVLASTLCCLVPQLISAQMLDPSIDRPDEPFSYFSQPTDVIGVMDARAATLISPEGYLYTGYGELMFFTGDPPVPVHQRVKTLLNGYLPVVQYGFIERGISYRFTTFAATLDRRPDGALVNFVRIKIRNTGKQFVTAHFSVAVRYEGEVNTSGGVPDNRFERPVAPGRPGEYFQMGEAFNPEWKYQFGHDAFLREQKVLYVFPPKPEFALRYTLRGRSNPPSMPRKLEILPTTPVGVVQYVLPLAANQETELVFKMPYVPLDPSTPEFAQLSSASFDQYLAQTIGFWNEILRQGIDIHVPEEKVNNTFKANLIYDLIARDQVGNDYVQNVNKFHYHAFWLRDASYIARMYDVSGYHAFARQVIDFFSGWQQPDGNFVSQGGQFDGWGQVMWAYGEHYRITKNLDFARTVYPAVQKAVSWLEQARREDPLHLMPATSPGDNEDVTGHVTGHNFWALAGLKNAIALAEALGHGDDAHADQAEYDSYKTALIGALRSVSVRTGGYMPPGLDVSGGQDWGNMLAVYPEQILDPFDPMVTATLNATRAKYHEGIMTYGDGRWLHHYLTMKNTETETIRGDQQLAIQELYALLIHTSSTHAGFEFDIPPWGTRDFGHNLAPHGWFAAKFRVALRNMLVREEQDKKLHLLSVVSPAWIKPGKVIFVNRAPTNFGEVNFQVRFNTDGATIRLSNRFKEAPPEMILHLPWFVRVNSVIADGKSLSHSNNRVVLLPANAREVRIVWQKIPGTPALTYDGAVNDYKAEYRRRYQHWLETGRIQ